MNKKKWKITFNSPVVLIFVICCFAATLLGTLTGGRSTLLLFATYRSSLLNPLTYIRFVTHVIGHNGWNHLIGNVSYLLLLGPMIEEKYGSAAMVKLIVLTGVITGIINYVFFPHVSLCGASGVVFAFILLSSFTGFRDGEIPLTVILVAVFYLSQQVVDGLFVKDNISNMGHIIGGLVGAGVGFALNKKTEKRGYRR